MSSIDPLLFIALTSALFFAAGFIVFKQFRPPGKDGQDNSQSLDCLLYTSDAADDC